MKIYTKKGDGGQTTLVDGHPISKSSPRLQTYGTLDELNSHLGLLLSFLEDEDAALKNEISQLAEVQAWLFQLGSQLACSQVEIAKTLPTISQQEIQIMEKSMDSWTEELPPLKNFILPGGHPAASQAHICRTVCRRAERHCVDILDLDNQALPAIAFLNRLSDYFFVLARLINHRKKIASTEWAP